MKELKATLPQYDYLYLGDNARAPYGSRSYETVYEYTLECVKHLFAQGCELVIVACNTASAKALRTIQQKDLPLIDPHKRVLGVIRPTTELVGNYSRTKQVGVLATAGTVNSMSYVIEIEKFFPEVTVFQNACPMWVPLIENNELSGAGTEYFVQKYLNELFSKSSQIDTVILGCTHYPILKPMIERYLPKGVTLLTQGAIVAQSLVDYFKRHPELEQKISAQQRLDFMTTDSVENFDSHATLFFGSSVSSKHLSL